MKDARFDFSPDLQPLLKRDLRGQSVEMRFQGRQSVKHLIESLGIPHTEIGTLNANGRSIGLDYITQDGDRIEIQPVAPVNLTEEPRFVLDGHLGRLASHLRMLGLDCLYDNGYEDDELVRVSVEEERVLLTRDRLLLDAQGHHAGLFIAQSQFNRTTTRSRPKVWIGEMGQAVPTLLEL